MKTSQVVEAKKVETKKKQPKFNQLNEQVVELLKHKLNSSYELTENISNQIRCIALRNDISDIPFFKKLEELAMDDLSDKCSLSHSDAIILLLDCAANFYEGIGFYEKDLDLTLMILLYAEDTGDVYLQRRAHNCIASAYTRNYDFSNSCLHSEKAYRFAREAKNPLFMFAALVNIVALLETMGLFQKALTLAINLRDQPHGSLQYDYLHLINANNGLKLCHLLDDGVNAKIFYEIAGKKFQAAHCLASENTKAYFEAGRCTYLIKIGKVEKALGYLKAALQKSLNSRNSKVKALLLCAQAEAYLVIHESAGLETCRQRLVELLDAIQPSCNQYEDILGILVKIHVSREEFESTYDGTHAVHYMRLLREYVLSVKHRHFFSEASLEIASDAKKMRHLENPHYDIPRWIVEKAKLDEISGARGQPRSDGNQQLVGLSFDIASLENTYVDMQLRSAQYDVAENWAVAGEFIAGHDGRHAFRVGRLAAAIAVQLGLSNDESSALELACRLHNIGNIAIASSPVEFNGLRPVGQFSLFCQHTILGERLLDYSFDPVLQMSASISKNHHECWNGSGYPNGLTGVSIPREARICSIADIFISLVFPARDNYKWEAEKAIRQIECMSGFQLDPDLVAPLIQVLYKGPEWIFLEKSYVKHSKRLNIKNKELQRVEMFN